jgi:hypothetical protein
MYIGIYIDFETYKQNGPHTYKIFSPSEDKEKINRKINEFLLIEQRRLVMLFDQYQEMRSDGILEEFFSDHRIEERIYNVMEFEEFEEYFMEHLINSPNVINQVKYMDFETIEIIEL